MLYAPERIKLAQLAGRRLILAGLSLESTSPRSLMATKGSVNTMLDEVKDIFEILPLRYVSSFSKGILCKWVNIINWYF